MERLDPDIVPAVVAMAKKSQDKMAVRHVKLLMKEWTFELTSLMQVLDEMTDPRIFMQVSGKMKSFVLLSIIILKHNNGSYLVFTKFIVKSHILYTPFSSQFFPQSVYLIVVYTAKNI